MKTFAIAVVLIASALVAGQAAARNDQATYALQEAFATPDAQQKLDKSIKMYFGRQPTPKVLQHHGEWKTNKKSSGFFKSDKSACEWAFLSAMIELQERAKKLGADGVVGIVSNYQNVEVGSETEFVCGSGALMSGVAFKGRIVRLAPR